MNLTPKQQIGIRIGVGVVVSVVFAIILYFVFKPKNAPNKTDPSSPVTRSPVTRSPVIDSPITKNKEPVIIKAKNGYVLTITNKDDLIKNKTTGQTRSGCRLIPREEDWYTQFKPSPEYVGFNFSKALHFVDTITLPSDIKCTTYFVDFVKLGFAAQPVPSDACKEIENSSWITKRDVITAGSKDFTVSPDVNTLLFEAA